MRKEKLKLHELKLIEETTKEQRKDLYFGEKLPELTADKAHYKWIREK